MTIISSPPADPRECRLFELLRQRDDQLYAKAIVLVDICAPLLDAISRGPFSLYTLHNKDHAKKLLHLAEYVIPENTLNQLSALELAVLIYAFYMHDIGMSLSEIEQDQLLGDEDFLDHIQNWPELSDKLAHAREELQNCASQAETFRLEKQIFQLQQAALAHYMRPIHATATRYEQLIKVIENTAKRADLFTVKNIAFEQPLIEICKSHNENAWALIDTRAPFEDRFPRDMVIAGQRINTQFCAAVLRVVDVLDFDRERTPETLFEHLNISRREGPGASVTLDEWNKHLSVHSIDITDHELRVSADCKHPAIEQSVRSFCKLIEEEFRSTLAILKRNPPDIMQNYDLLLPAEVQPRIRSLGYVYKGLSFQLNQSAIMDLLMGENLYSGSLDCIRELVQNALDACTARSVTRPSRAYRPEISLKLELEDDEIWLSIKDNGIGMDEHVIANYFFQIGDSYYRSNEFKTIASDTRAKHPRIISRFGIGFLSLFMMTDLIEVRTCNRASPRQDFKERDIVIDGRTSMAVIRERDLGRHGTSIRMRLKDPPSAFDMAAKRIGTFIQSKILRPQYPVSFEGGRVKIVCSPDTFYGPMKEHAEIQTTDGLLNVRMIEVCLEDFSDWLRGKAYAWFIENETGLCLFTNDIFRIRVATEGTSQVRRSTLCINPNEFFQDRPGNRLTVNGIIMREKKIRRFYRSGREVKKRRSLPIVWDVDVLDHGHISFDVSRSQVRGVQVLREFHQSMMSALGSKEMVAKTSPETLELLREFWM